MFWNKKSISTDKRKINAQPRILIIEDDPNNHPLYRQAFEAIGFEVILLSTADGSFIDEVLKINPDIISMDIRIGDRDGLEASKLLKQDERTKHLPIMILTNFTDREKLTLAKEIGVCDYISLQAHAMSEIPHIFRRYLDDPEHFIASHPFLQD